MGKNQEFQGLWSRYGKIMKILIIVIYCLIISMTIYFLGTTLAAINMTNETAHFVGKITDPKSLKNIEESYQQLIYSLLVLLGGGIFACITYFGFYQRNWNISKAFSNQWISRILKIINDRENTKHIYVLSFLSIIFLLASLAYVLYSTLLLDLSVIWLRLSSLDEPLNFRNILIGIFGGISLIMLAWRSASADREAQVKEERRDQDRKELQMMEERRIEESRAEERNEERRFDERFANAVKFISTDLDATSYPAHLGAITALRDLALDNNAYIQRCLDILCSCNQWMEGYLKRFADKPTLRCYADRHLTESTRIAQVAVAENQHLDPLVLNSNNNRKDSPVTLYHERRSQDALKSIAFIFRKLGLRHPSQNHIKNIDLYGKMLCGINLSGLALAGANFERVYLNGANLKRSNLSYANLSRANMKGIKLQRADLRNANLKRAKLPNSNLTWANLEGANFENANLKGGAMRNADLENANLENANLQGASLISANLKKANLSQIQAARAKLNNANLQGALLYEAQLQGVSLISANLKKADLEDADLREANLTEANLQKAQCAETIFEKAKLVKANLKGAYLRENVLSYADLTGANLYETDLTEASIYGTNFHNANIQKATLIGADITESNLTGANMTESNLQGISIEKTKCQRTIFNQAKMHAVDFIDCDLQGSIFISSELQSASFNKSNLEKCTLLGCNLYGVVMKNNNLQNIIFDAISDTGHIKTKGTRNTWIKGIGKGLIDSTNDEEHISRIQQAWDKTDKGEMPKGLNALQQASILEKDTTGRWVIMPSKIEELKEFYRALIAESDKGLFIPISDSMDIISKDHGHLSKDYPEIQKTLKAILADFKKELKK